MVMAFKWSPSPRLSPEFWLAKFFSNRHGDQNGRSLEYCTKAEKFKRGLSQNQEPIRSENLYGCYFPAALIYIIKVKFQEDQLFCSLNFSDIMWKPPIESCREQLGKIHGGWNWLLIPVWKWLWISRDENWRQFFKIWSPWYSSAWDCRPSNPHHMQIWRF